METNHRKKPYILIVDDDPDILEGIITILETQPYQAIGLETERVRMFNISSAMAPQFVEAASELTEEIHKIGENPL